MCNFVNLGTNSISCVVWLFVRGFQRIQTVPQNTQTILQSTRGTQKHIYIKLHKLYDYMSLSLSFWYLLTIQQIPKTKASKINNPRNGNCVVNYKFAKYYLLFQHPLNQTFRFICVIFVLSCQFFLDDYSCL